MAVDDYQYAVEQCDVSPQKRKQLEQYRVFRRKCLEHLRGNAETSIFNQVHTLAWYTTVFRTLNEARRLEPKRAVNGAMWELMTAGYANLIALGVRKLVDKDPKANSVWSLITHVQKRPELMSRENFICYDGLPYDYLDGYKNYIASLEPKERTKARWLSTTGPTAWATSKMMHKSFDALVGNPIESKRSDRIDLRVIEKLKKQLELPVIGKVRGMADQIMAHAQPLTEEQANAIAATYDEVNEALKIIVVAANFLSSRLFYDAAFGQVVATPQFNVLHALDRPWVTSKNLPALQEHWDTFSKSMDDWAYEKDDHLLPTKSDIN